MIRDTRHTIGRLIIRYVGHIEFSDFLAYVFARDVEYDLGQDSTGILAKARP